MTSDAQTFPRGAVRFFRELEANNTKKWFEAHRSAYEAGVRQPVIALLEIVNEELAAYAPAYRVADPRTAVSRPHRDTRFSKDKRPYRTDISVVLPREGRARDEVAGFFFSIAPAGVEVLGGVYMPGAPQLAALRRLLAAEAPRFERVVTRVVATRLVGTLQGERLKRVPSGYPADGPAAELVRYKQLYFRTRIEPTPATGKALAGDLSRRFRAMTPFVELLDEALAGVRG